MRLRRIGAQSILHYDTLNLDFGEGVAALHILYGHNETGKSTLLNLLLDLLFGGTIRKESGDYYDTRSRIEGLLEYTGGSPLLVQRKKNRNRLTLNVDNTPELIEEQLARCLGGYDRDRFTLLFGFNHQRLRDGGQSLLKSGGHAGVSLFEAGGGIQYLQNLLGRLSVRSGELLDSTFHARSVKLLNKAWRAYRDAETAVRKGSMRGEDWRRKRDEINSLERQVNALKADLQKSQREQAKLQRISRVRSMITELRTIRDNLLGMGEVITLSVELDQRIPELIKWRVEELKELDGLEKDRLRQVKMSQEILLDPLVLEFAGEIEILNEGLQQYVTKKTEELPASEEKLRIRRGDAENLLKSIAPDVSLDGVERLRIQYADEESITSLADNLKQTRLDVNREQQDYDELVTEHVRIENALKEFGAIQDISGFRRQINRVREQVNIKEDIAQKSTAIEQKRQELNRLLQGQTLWSGSLEQLSGLSIPLRETMDQYAQLWLGAQKNCNDWDRNLKSEQDNLATVKNDLEVLELAGHVPVEADLEEARAQRDKGWSLVKQVWQDDLPEACDKVQSFAGDVTLADSFESAMKQADRISDTMRRDSERSVRRALFLLKKEQTERAINGLLDKRNGLEKEFDQLVKAWYQEWKPCRIQPKTPAEMKDWVSNYYQPLVQVMGEVQLMELQLERLNQERDSYILALHEASGEVKYQPPLNLGLRTLLECCDEFVNGIEEKERNRQAYLGLRKENQKKLEDQGRTLVSKRIQLDGLQAEWEEFCRRYPSLPQKDDVANAYIRELKKLFDCVKEINGLQLEIAAKQKACQVFETEAYELAKHLGEQVTASLVLWVRHVRERLASARTADNLLKQIQTELQQIEEKIQGVRSNLSEYESELQQLQEKYDCTVVDSLSELVSRSKAYKELDADHKRNEQSVIQVGDGLSVAELEAELSELEHPDELPVQLAQLEAGIQDLSGSLDKDKERLQGLKVEFCNLDGSNADAAIKAQQAEQYLAEVDQHWNEYLRVELARRFLQRTIDEFREQNQSTILGRASNIFRRLTLNKYLELTVEYDGDTPYLEAIHSDGIKRRVHQLSDGTLDQLFLSLRLAFVEQHLLDNSDPLPLIMDDILVNFDDKRTKATLEVLHELAEKTQILYFTHHQSVVESARGMADAGRLLLHTLEK